MKTRIVLTTTAPIFVAVCATGLAASTDLGNGFMHHGVATPVSNHRGTVATVDGQGRNIVLVWLFDHRGGYALLLIDAETGKSEEFAMPFAPGGDCPYASILSSRNKFYTHFNSHFCEFDPVQRRFTFHHQTVPQMAMSMTEDDRGLIWLVSYPQSGVASFDPRTREFKDYGHVHKENWQQYQRSIAADDAGWIYFGMGNTSSHILGFDPASGQAKPMIPDSERRDAATGQVCRDLNGKVYGSPGGEDDWYEFHRGQARKIGTKPELRAKPFITSSQSLFHREFPDGTRIIECDLIERVLTVEAPNGGRRTRLEFDYRSEGAHVMGLAAAPDGTICGGTAFPMRFFSYDPKSDRWINRASYGKWNTVTRQGDRFFVGGYTQGFLLEWDPAREWVETKPDDPAGNPRFLTSCNPDIYRPHALLALPDASQVILAGTPGYGYTGGGLLFWDRRTRERTLLKHTDILPQQSTMALVALPDGKILAGTTTGAGTGGEKKADQAELYVMDLGTKRVEWHEPLLPGTQTYSDLHLARSGLVYGFADYHRFFVFDPVRRVIIHQPTTDEFGRTCSQQAPRTFVADPKGNVYILFAKGIARVEPATFAISMLAESPVRIGAAGDILDGRIYFASGSHVYSFKLPPAGE